MRKNHLMAAFAAGAMMIGVQTGMQAQTCPHQAAVNPKAEAAFTELRQAMQAFAKSDIVPQMRTWKTQLDGAMSAEDLQTLNALRARSTALKIQTQSMMKTMKDKWKSGDSSAIKDNRDQMRTLFEQRKALMLELKPLAMRYRSTLETIGQQAKPRMEAWKTKGKRIVDEWRQKHEKDLADAPRMDGDYFLPHPGRGMMNPEMMKRAMAARFMLWDGGELDQEVAPIQQGNDADIR